MSRSLTVLDGPDKHLVTDLPQIDCAARLPLCRARCCTFAFTLWRQDLADGLVRQDPEQPNRIARHADGSCVHLEQGRCTIYAQRPAGCRTYDCRRDPRVWIDFEQRIPAP